MEQIVLIGTYEAVRDLAAQLKALGDRVPEPIGCILIERCILDPGLPVLGSIDEIEELEPVLVRCSPTLALVCESAGSDTGPIVGLLRRLGVRSRVIPALVDLLGDGHQAQPGSLRLPGAPIDVASLIGRTPHPVDTDSIEQLLRGRRVLITGAGGSIGSEIAARVASFGPKQLILMERAENALFEIDRRIREEFPAVSRCAVLHDVVDADGTLAHLNELHPEIVFHAAAHKHVPLMEDHPAHAVTNNVFGTKSVVDAAVATGVDRCILISSDKAVNPSSVMGATKRLAELYLQGLQPSCPGTRLGMVRFGNVLGSACSVIPIWASQLAFGRPITVTDERMTRYFMTIPEAATLVIQSAAIEHDRVHAPVFVLDMGEPVKIIDLARRFCAASGYGPGEAEIVISGARPGEKLHEELAYTAEQLVPTTHPGISTWSGALPESFDLDTMIAELGRVRASRDRDAVVRVIRALVPEMTSNIGSIAEVKGSERVQAPTGAAA